MTMTENVKICKFENIGKIIYSNQEREFCVIRVSVALVLL